MFQKLFGNSPIILAPMAGVTNLPFRFFSKQLGASGGLTEFVSVLSLYHTLKQHKLAINPVRWMIQTDFEEKPVGMQIFGFNPQHFAKLFKLPEFIKILNNFDFLDLNVGCPVPKICNSGAGAKLLTQKRLPILREIIATVKKIIPDFPFSIKIRAGYKQPIDINKFTEMLNSFELLMVTIHPRLAISSYQNVPNHDLTRQLAIICDHPVIVNGGIKSLASAKKFMNMTKTDGAMIGKAARHYPWIFSPKYQNVIPSNEFYSGLHHFLDLNEEFGYPNIVHIRNQMVQFIRGFPGSSQLRNQFQKKANNINELRSCIEEIKIVFDEAGISKITRLLSKNTSESTFTDLISA